MWPFAVCDLDVVRYVVMSEWFEDGDEKWLGGVNLFRMSGIYIEFTASVGTATSLELTVGPLQRSESSLGTSANAFEWLPALFPPLSCTRRSGSLG